MNFLNQYKVIKDLEGGEQGIVQLISDSNNIYVLKKVEKNDKDSQKNFEREQSIMNQLNNKNHPNIMKIFRCFEDQEYYYCIYEYIDGQTLEKLSEKYKQKNQQLEQNLIISILKGIINGLIFLEQNKILHRDIQLENIMISNKNEIKIIDFGRSRFCEDIIIGTLIAKKGFISPEMYNAINSGKKEGTYGLKIDIF